MANIVKMIYKIETLNVLLDEEVISKYNLAYKVALTKDINTHIAVRKHILIGG